MAYEVRDLSGSIFKNRNKQNEKSADMTGSARIFGRDVWVNAWVKTDKNGEKWISMSFREKEQKPEYDQREERPAPAAKDNSDFPF
ncbi:MAG: hypothetical protein AMJ56_00605 [Anaerolineae bacterium SG8_19]|jgi:hypothetical protein|nr:MAG: hypothetical protein AMJ56_00605 [Anaerolineae bacterium SG8_19]